MIVRIVVTAGRTIRAARRHRKPSQGLAGLVLICFGVSLWSIPAALVTGGALLIADLLTD